MLLHTVGPRWYDYEDGDKEDARTLLRECVDSIFTLGSRLGAGSVSIPPISSGLFGYPKALCAEDMLNRIISIS